MHRGVRQERIAKDLVAASATALLLAILQKGPSYGYAIIQEVRTLSGGELEWSTRASSNRTRTAATPAASGSTTGCGPTAVARSRNSGGSGTS